MRKRRKEKRRIWLKLAIDASTHELISAVVSLDDVGDNEVLPRLLNPLRWKIGQVSADGAYDTKNCHQVLRKKGIKPSIPPHSNGGFWEDDHLHNAAASVLISGDLDEWKQKMEYHRARYRKRGCIDISSYSVQDWRDYDAQVGEALVSVKVTNKALKLGMSVSNRVE